jgi:hypothetical protein
MHRRAAGPGGSALVARSVCPSHLPSMAMDRKLLNVIIMGLAFFAILTAFQTSSFYQASM